MIYDIILFVILLICNLHIFSALTFDGAVLAAGSATGL